MKPNILYIHSHDTGRSIQPYGYAVSTPNLQALAEDGILFRQAFCAAPTCSPSRAALLTGQSPHSAGMLGLAHRGWRLDDYRQHIVHTLRDGAGYFSAQGGVQHVAPWETPEIIGYDRILGRENPERLAVEFLDAAPREPFFLDVGFSETHRFGKSTPPGLFNANEGEPHGDARSARVPASLPDVPDVRADFADYAVSATRLDDKIGQVFDALKRNGLWGDTLVIATTDHGLAFPGMKCTCRDAGLGVMLILRGPGVEGGRASDALVSQIDLFPTLCDLLGIAPPAWLQGRSLMPVLRGESEGVNDAIFGEVTYHGAYDPQRAVRTTRWKYIRGWHETPRPLLMNCDDGLSRRWMAEHGGAEQFLDAEALYDLTFDSNETHNLAADPAHAAMRDEMRARLETWLRDTNDPLLNGPVPPSQPPSAA